MSTSNSARNGLSASLARAKTFFEGDVLTWWRDVACKLPKEFTPFLVPLLLSGIFLSLREFLETMGQGSAYFRIKPFQISVDEATRIVDRDTNGRTRRVTVWIDSGLGGPPPTLRVGTSKGTASNGGVLVTPGVANEIGKVPANTELWMSTTVALSVYVIEEG